MNIAGLDKAAVLAALYNASQQRGMGLLHARGREDMTVEQAQKELDSSRDKYFDYLHGRVMKVGLMGDDVKTLAYDRDNGPGAAEAAVQPLRSSK